MDGLEEAKRRQAKPESQRVLGERVPGSPEEPRVPWEGLEILDQGYILIIEPWFPASQPSGKGRGLIAMSWDRTQCLLKSRFRQPWGGAEDPGQQETVSQNLGWGPEAHSSCPPPPGDAYVIT